MAQDPNLQIRLEVITPLFLYGADQRQPEIRAASVRGQLRYWFRAIEGAKTTELVDLWGAESAVFGSTASSSTVSLRFYATEKLKIEKHPMLLHRSELKSQSWQDAISPDQELRLEIIARPGIGKVPPQVIRALEVWLLLGGLGKRSRRMFGALEQPALTRKLTDGSALADKIEQRLKDIVKPSATPSVPQFPTLHPDYSRVVVGTVGCSDWKSLIEDLFGLLRRGDYRSREKTFGYAMEGRRASPLIAQVRRIGGQYYPVLTAMRSTPDKDIEWNILDKFMDYVEKESRWQGKTVWGGRLAR